MCREMRVQARPSGIALLAGALLLAGCGKAPIQQTSMEAMPSTETAGAVAISTKNTTRLGGASAAADAAAVARSVYPGVEPQGRPQAVVLVDERDWPAALAASVLAGRPLHAPLLYTEGAALGSPSTQALGALAPTGAPTLAGAQGIRVGEAAAPSELRLRSVQGSDPAQLAIAIERLQAALRGHRPHRVIVTASDAPGAMTAPAAGLSALTGAPILFVQRSAVPTQTAAELARLRRPAIYVVGPASVVSDAVLAQLGRLGAVTRIAASASSPAAVAVAVARFNDSTGFGWGIHEAGHGLVFAASSRPLDGPAAAPLAASGDFAPLLLLEGPNTIPSPVSEYVSNLQPGYPASGPVYGVYNHGWLIGDGQAISPATQATLDAMLEITPRKTSTEPAAPELETPPATTTAP